MEYPAGWTCEVTVLRLENYLLGTLVHAEALCVAEHVEACDSCMHTLVLIRYRVPTGRGSESGGPRA